MLGTISTRRNVLSLKFPQKKHVPPFPCNLFTRNTVANTVREEALITNRHNVHRSKIRKTQTNRLSSQGLVAQPTGSFKKPNQPRLLSNSYSSWHSMSNCFMGSSGLFFATSQSCRKREILCNPTTYYASLLTLSA